jgi:peptide chain release factor 2
MTDINDIELDPRELRIDVLSAGVYHTVRITHVPTGIVVSAHTQKSIHKNRDLAVQQLKEKLLERQWLKTNFE